MSKTETSKDLLNELVDLVSLEIKKTKTSAEEQYWQSQSRKNPDQAHRYYLQGCIRGYDDVEAILYKAYLNLRKEK